MSASSPEKVEQLAAAMAAEREMAAGKSPTSPLFSMPSFPDDDACQLLNAAMEGSLRRTKELLAAGVPAACADANGHTPLHKCAFMGYADIIGLLLDAGADVNAADLMRHTPLHSAAFQGYADIVGVLLDAGADVEATDTVGNTPLHRASREGNLEVMEVLLGAGADPNAGGGSERNTPLHIVALSALDDPLPAARLLLRHGAAPEVLRDKGVQGRSVRLREEYMLISLILSFIQNKEFFFLL